MQTTLKSSITFRGTGLHLGKPASLVINPASCEHGIWFRRVDLEGVDTLIPARWDAVASSQLCTKLVNASGVSISTVEHVMAALAGCGVHNALVEVSGPEVPIMDGSAIPFVRGIMQRGLRRLNAPVRAFEVCQQIHVSDGAASVTLLPSREMRIDFEIDFNDLAIGRQSLSLNMANGSFVRELSDSRTFCMERDVAQMQAKGLALGGAPGKNAVVFDDRRVVSPGGLRRMDEPVRHKMLDALGDLTLAGVPVIGHYKGVRAGHTLTNMALRQAFATPGAMRMIVCDKAQTQRLPGYGLMADEIPAVA